MKNYTYSVDIDLSHKGESFMDELMSEVNNEKKQSELTYKINKESTKIHREILVDLIAEVNKLIEPHGVSFGEIRQYHNSNEYVNHMAICRFSNGFSCIIMVDGEPHTRFEHSKYTTYTGEHHIKITRKQDHSYQDVRSHDMNGRILNVDDLLDYIRFDLKSHIENNNR